mmetsp:Transcript_22580/g.36885  ORF Transcript_22580/g.36885 Transcript_22580/m.36885 type:complete len:115 (-) Transcript_22580:53-397(-)
MSSALCPSLDAVRAFLVCDDHRRFVRPCACKLALGGETSGSRIISRLERAIASSEVTSSIITHPPTTSPVCTAPALCSTIGFSADTEVLAISRLCLPIYPGAEKEKKSDIDFHG